jgi:predicted Zn-dependent peptidase
MTVEITTLANGLRVVSDHMPHVETVALGMWVGVGARHEDERQAGISHLLEHMAFKGTATRSAQDIAEEIEAVGGELNAATSLETTAYFARVLKGDEDVAIRLIADILQNSTFAEAELKREREVILQEIAAIRDNPDEIVYDLVHDAAYPGQSVGRPVIGTPASVTAIGREDLAGFLAARYRPASMVFAAAGAVRHDVLVRHVEAQFGGLSRSGHESDTPARYEGGLRADKKPFEQSHLLFGFEAPSYRDPAFYTAQVMSGLFGGGMSSRLFQEVRERRGLCYSIYSSAWGLKDTGMLGVHAATGPESMAELTEVIGAELKRLAGEGPREVEVQRAKAQLKAGLLMALESSSARVEQIARQLLAHGRIVPSEELIERVDAVGAEAVRDFTAGLASKRPSVAVVGAGKKSLAFATRAAQLFPA